MKKIITACILLIATAAQAQVVVYQDTRNKLLVGIKAGVNLSNVWDEQGQDFVAKSKLGFVGGGYLSIPIGKYLGVQPEVLYSKKGFKGSGTLIGSSYTFTRTTTHIDVPILLQIKPAGFLTLLAGPQYSYLLRRRDTYTFGNIGNAQEQEFQNDNVRKNMLGAVVGADFIVSPLSIGARAGWDLTKNNGDGTSTTPQYKNRWVQLTLGFQF